MRPYKKLEREYDISSLRGTREKWYCLYFVYSQKDTFTYTACMHFTQAEIQSSRTHLETGSYSCSGLDVNKTACSKLNKVKEFITTQHTSQPCQRAHILLLLSTAPFKGGMWNTSSSSGISLDVHTEEMPSSSPPHDEMTAGVVTGVWLLMKCSTLPFPVCGFVGIMCDKLKSKTSSEFSERQRELPGTAVIISPVWEAARPAIDWILREGLCCFWGVCVCETVSMCGFIKCRCEWFSEEYLVSSITCLCALHCVEECNTWWMRRVSVPVLSAPPDPCTLWPCSVTLITSFC